MNNMSPNHMVLCLAAGICALCLPAAAPQLLAQEADVEQVEDNRSVSAESAGGAPAASPAEDPQIPADARSGDAPGADSRPAAQGEETEPNR